MKKRKLISMVLAATLALTSLTGCGKKDSSSDDSVLRVGMECAYAPFNWSQETDELANGEKAVPIYGTNMYAYGYDVIVAEKLAKQMGKTLEIHKVEWDSIGMSLDAGDYDVIIAGMGRTKEREASYSFTDPYYYRTNCLVVKKGSGLEGILLLMNSKIRHRHLATADEGCEARLKPDRDHCATDKLDAPDHVSRDVWHLCRSAPKHHEDLLQAM